MGYKQRDIEIAFLDGDLCLVAACDSCGAVGAKEFDVVSVPSYIVGRFTARVALLEVLSVGAKPTMMTVTVANELHPTGEEMLAGVRDELESIGIDSLPTVISTEKNMPTGQTGLGISVVAVCKKTDLRLDATLPGDAVYCLGTPKVGAEVHNPDDPEIIRGQHIRQVLENQAIHDVIPVGSKGISGEADLLASHINGRFIPISPDDLTLTKSAGPSTCLIFTCPPDFNPQFPGIPLRKIGTIETCR